MDDQQIIELYNRRNEQAIVETSHKYGKYCFSIANSILSDKQDSEECINDTWLHAWNAIPPCLPRCLRLYLARITRNIAIDKFKRIASKKRGGGTIAVVLDEISEFLPDSDHTETPTEEQELMRTVNLFLRTISERDCNIFINRYFHAEAINLIADKYALTEGHVLKILSRTRIKLKNYLESRGYKI